MKKNLVYVALFISAVMGGCNKMGSKNGSDKGNYSIKGKLQNPTAGPIYLSELGEQQFVTRDTATVNPDGTFEFSGKMPETNLYRVSLTDQNMMLLVIDTPNIEVSADAQDLRKTYEVKGSKETQLMKSLMGQMERMQLKAANLEKRFVAAQQAGQQDSMQYLQDQYMVLPKQNAGELKSMIRNNPSSFVSTYATLSLLNPEEDFEFMDSMAVVFEKKVPESKYVSLLSNKLAALRNVAVGQPAPDINLPTPDGQTIALSSLKGKYVLVDFWASWCGPCRQENPNVVRMYQKYKDKGFEIYGVSLDESKEKWVNAIAKDNLTWPHVSDLKGWNSAAAVKYNIQAIPQTLLLDKEGKIIAKNLRGKPLEEKIASLLP
ncbi:MAG: alkyl hydroperoxide reductase [Cytophagales bacterium CG18_big_fil_WC_8_21_14_2_50_42_9]|nr:MAG: alkyl hydroperoxide reductase [Cytophagales bacterium CG18_big_fil_WC_8_21_14_2_50_42_9]